MGKTIRIDPVTRIEGHADVQIELDDDNKVTSAKLIVKELRGFEKILTGMEVEKMPLITARICGACPISHHLASVRALDYIYNAEPPRAGIMFREIMNLAGIINSHVLALFILSGPELIMGLNVDPEKRNIIGLNEYDSETTKKAISLRTISQHIIERIGGRVIHPVTSVPGGITFSLKDMSTLNSLSEDADEALKIACSLLPIIKEKLKRFTDEHHDTFINIQDKTYYMGTVKEGKLNLYEGILRVMNPDGQIVSEFHAEEYISYLVEEPLTWSYMKPVYFKDEQGQQHIHRVSTLARINVADEIETPIAQKELEEFRKNFGRPCHYTIMHHYARMIEIIYACEKIKELLKDDAIMGPTRIPVTSVVNNRGISHVEAPRGTLIHDYTVDERGVVQKANLLIATQQNYAAINDTIRQCAEYFLSKSNTENNIDIDNNIEFYIRAYDPCLSCATHLGNISLNSDDNQEGSRIKFIRKM
ncbi:MAG: Ni/Fe hydrogenase subunit alpha [Desulfobacteraceae bacterium]|nr:Ni/Fe hydrogenase subunit alpha [Desulfobacteraceae bacterium]